jgi:hypothetical protein
MKTGIQLFRCLAKPWIPACAGRRLFSGSAKLSDQEIRLKNDKIQ